MPNRLASEASPYLRQHGDNPVDWYPWGDEAFAAAKAQDKPIFLSIGYSSCHWCHVMEHESFEDQQIADILNRGFVSIKVDREERPDLDDAFMGFVQALTGRGGWPMSVFMNSEGAPFFGGTYWPKDDRGTHGGFGTILLQVEGLWKTQRERIEETAREHAEVLKQAAKDDSQFDEGEPFTRGMIIERLAESFDEENGGFGDAPKFPPHSSLELLLAAGAPYNEMAFATLEKMALGGIHDHVGGGFHRYSTDGQWHLPHFEKMLYDNALLLKSFADAESADAVRSELFGKTAAGIVGWMEREMRSEDGLFYSALDADSEGEEGKFYVWSYPELTKLPDSKAFMEAYGCSAAGNFQDEATGLLTGQNILHRQTLSGSFDAELASLLKIRNERTRPLLDDKAIVAWNGLAILGLVSAGRLDLAEQCADAILKYEKDLGFLPRYIWHGEAKGSGFLEDYAFFTLALFALDRPDDARRFGVEMVSQFYDENRGGFFATSADHESLFGRAKPIVDQPIPSANSAAIKVLFAMDEGDMALFSLSAFQGWMNHAPMACEALFTAAADLTFVETSLDVISWEYEDGRFKIEIAFALVPGWTIARQGIVVSVDGQALEWDGEPREIDGSETVIFYGDFAERPTDVIVEYQPCTDQVCLPPRVVQWALSDAADVL